MKKLNLEKMESLEGGGFWSIVSCAITLHEVMSWEDSFYYCADSERNPVT